MRSIALMWFMAWPAFALEIWYPVFDSRMERDRGEELADFSEWSGEPATMRLIKLDQYVGQLNTLPTRTLAQMPSIYFFDAIDAGWVPVLMFDQLIETNLYALESVTMDQVNDLATPNRGSVAWRLGQKLLPEAMLVENVNHGNCLRSVVIGQADACMTHQVFVDRYFDSFGVQFNQIGGGLMGPPVSIFATPDIAEELIARTDASTALTAVKPYKYVQYIAERDQGIFEIMR